MKNLRPGIYLLIMLFISCTSLAAGSKKAMQSTGILKYISSFAEKDQVIELPPAENNIYNRLTDFEDKEFTFYSRFKKKHKTKFLIQHLNFSHYIKKPGKLFLLQNVDLLQELHVYSPSKEWPIRPAYYNFLFRLCPF